MNHFNYKPFYRRNLPHIQPPGATFFVTFHLSGSLPRAILKQWRAERHQIESKKLHLLKPQNISGFAAAEHTTFEQKPEYREWKRQWFRKFEKTLDYAQSGPLWLKDERIAKVVAESLHYRDGEVYRLDAYCIMANHVHVVFAPLAIHSTGTDTVDSLDNDAQTNSLCYNTLPSIMQSLKGYTAWKANRLLGRSGAFWHHESYDHAVRNASEWKRIITYVLNNPIKAGLVDEWEKWQWSYYRDPDCTVNC